MYGFRRGVGGGGGGNVSTLGGGANGLITLWNGTNTVTGDASGTWAGTGHTFVLGSPTFNASDGHFTGPAGASFGPSSVGGGFTNQPAGDTIDLVSDDAGDTTQQVTVIGVLAGVDASENIALNGVTPVTSAGTYDLILALVLNNVCTGTVTASETSGGLAITTIAPAALSAGLQTFAAIDGYGKVLQIVASGATTKTVGIGGYALGGGIQREPVVLTGTTKVNTTATWEGAVQFYLGDLEATRTVTLNSIAGFDFKSTGGVFEPVEAGSLAASNLTPGQVLLAATATGSTGVTSITGDTGLTGVGTGTGFKLGIGTDVFLSRAAAATLRIGEADAAVPVSQTLQAQGSRGGTDTNVAGGSLTIRPGAGTGSATGSSLIFQTPTAGASGTTAQTQATRLTISGGSIVPTVPIVSGTYIYASNFRSYTGDNLDDIGQSGTRFKAGYFGTSLVVGTATWTSGNGSPETVVTAPVGSFYSRLDGGTGTSWYVKESGTGNTGWVAK